MHDAAVFWRDRDQHAPGAEPLLETLSFCAAIVKHSATMLLGLTESSLCTWE
jgi:hypothetical protein